MQGIVLSKKYKEFLRYSDASCEILEGTTAAGKTTVGIIKFMLKVANNKNRMHIIAAQNLGVAEKNILNKECGLLEVFNGYVEYNPRGKGKETMPHIMYYTPNGNKIIYIAGYDTISRWKNILGGQYGCCYIDEINTAALSFVKQIIMRCDYLMATLNPDDPDKEIYKELINRCRPLPKYINTIPEEMLKYLDEEPHDKWVWWYFTFDDNLGLSKEKKENIRSAHTPGSIEYKHYILGLRGKAEGIVFDNFSVKNNCMKELDIIALAHARTGEKIIQYTAGLDTSYSSKSEDTIAMTFLGITNLGKLIYIDEQVINNRDTHTPFAPSDIVEKLVKFLDRNREKYGFARDVFIDSADAATITEAKKYKQKHGSIYNFVQAHKALKIIDRINLQKGWIATGHYYVCELCKNHIKEMQVYSWSDKANNMQPEDANNHTIDSQCYAWIPYKNAIGKSRER